MFSWLKKQPKLKIINEYEEALKTKNEITKILFPIGEKFLTVGNDFEVNPNAKTYDILEVIGYTEITQEKRLTPVFKDVNGEEYISFSIKLKYSSELEETLKMLTAKQAYKLLSSIVR